MIVIIMAGGMGKRMDSDLPKVLHNVICPYDKNLLLPMLVHVILTATKLNPLKIFIIVGKFREIISNTIDEYIENNTITNPELIEYVDQEIALGTGHAIKCTLPQIALYPDEKAIILSGDVPLISLDTLKKLDGIENKLLVTELDNPYGCGRILLNSSGEIEGIREEKDCNKTEKQIKLVNCGIYQIKINDLVNLIPLINNSNKAQEYYLTDIIELMVQYNIKIEPFILEKQNHLEIKNVNTKQDLFELNQFIYGMTFIKNF
jgi:bifunctional N-acetylglucosamine-1-phosphate-uridyltransferase/glucosamine-1-phosphate-acetyltransferase GlmU-like protein